MMPCPGRPGRPGRDCWMISIEFHVDSKLYWFLHRDFMGSNSMSSWILADQRFGKRQGCSEHVEKRS
jgi:hypothetical protein